MNTASNITIQTLKNKKVLLELSIDNKVVGRLKFDTFDRPILYIESLHVNKDWRRARFGTRLMMKAVEQANQCKVVSLYVGVNNVDALFFYAKLDFFITFAKKNKRGEKYYLMSKQI